MRNNILFFIFIFSFSYSFSQEKFVLKKYPDGTNHVIYYYDYFFLKKVLVKQEIFYPNGHLEYSGEWKYGKEHGEWIYYYENGKIKVQEFWLFGNETGKWKEFDEAGNLVRSIEYKSGKKIKETNY